MRIAIRNCFDFIADRRVPMKFLARNWRISMKQRFHGKGSQFSTSTYAQIKPKSVGDFKKMILGLDEEERVHLETALEQIKASTPKNEVVNEVTRHQLKLVFMQSALPFVGFGFLDNFIMILAGEYIDLTIGVSLGISTMAAAACGNLISDLLGLGLADSVEALCRKLGLPSPDLSFSQLSLSSVRWAHRMGRVVGITVGCIIGMAPLLWFDDDVHCHDNKESKP